MKSLYHLSETPGTELFSPRPSPSFFENLSKPVVFAIEERLMHNYVLPRDCPRVTYYAAMHTTEKDRERFFGSSSTTYIITLENGWYERIKTAIVYAYAFDPAPFRCIDACAGYYISATAVKPIAVTKIDDVMGWHLRRKDIELRFTPSLIKLAEDVKNSSLNFSSIRMRNAKT